MSLQVSKVSDVFIRMLARDYLYDNQSMKSLAKLFETSPATISNILFRGVTEGILDDATCVAIIKKTVSNTENIGKTYNRWLKASILREINLIKQDIQSENYIDYFFNDDCAPSLKSLRCNRVKAERQLTILKERLQKLESGLK